VKSAKKVKVRGFWKRGRPKKDSLRYILSEIEEILRKDKKNP
jgi:hypothetical protein